MLQVTLELLTSLSWPCFAFSIVIKAKLWWFLPVTPNDKVLMISGNQMI